ncbi:unannotated protein [freshwater metagenome]|uniref:Unannotated protein n=1 Tax=freshwater metagenome TaxID=449393 RepID=A0A6J6TT17_9ZZZZ|nr:hypothetical protein [Actinomycetota bacterium]
MRRSSFAYAVLPVVLVASLSACGSESADPGTEVATDSAGPSPTASGEPSEQPEPTAEPSVDPDPAVVEGLDLAFDADTLTMTLDVPDLVASDRVLVLYRWQTRDVRVAIESTLVGDEPALNAVWADNQTEMSGKVKDVDAAWDLEAGTVTITLRERLNGDRAEVSATGLGPKDRYPTEQSAYAVTEAVERS